MFTDGVNVVCDVVEVVKVDQILRDILGAGAGCLNQTFNPGDFQGTI